MNKKTKFDTKLIHTGEVHDAFGSVITPIYQTSTFKCNSADHGADLFAGRDDTGFIYSRIGNPTVSALEEKLAALENGSEAIALSSGMAAVSTVFASLLSAGDHVISTEAVYGPSRSILETLFSKFGVEATFVDTSGISNIKKAIKPNTTLLYLESPSNPTMQLTDIATASEVAHAHNILVCVDNTFCSPYLQRPLDLGADISLHSLTKSINGHSDLIGGALIAKDPAIGRALRKTMIMMGGCMDPHQAFLVMRGVKTLSIRIERAQENAQQVAEFLESHEKVAWINYPGLKSFKQYQLAQEQMAGAGSMIAFGVKGGLEAGKKVMDNVSLAGLAVSLGGIETLIQHPASMTHAGLSAEAKGAAGITDDLIRYSIGIEAVEDIIGDIDDALHNI
ncbi:MAG: PLP-dependent transferase [Gammaproteobacteria bacterium]|nr:PLP-dependent transferase [Gammaproteobacteria bacterium]